MARGDIRMSDARFVAHQLYYGYMSRNISEVRYGLASVADVVNPSEFFQRESLKAEFVEMEPVDVVLSHEPRRWYFRDNAEPDACWTNSILPALIIPGVGYCEGWLIGHDDYVRHAWNSYNGRYFDLTFEIAAKPGAVARYVHTFSCDGRRANALNNRKCKLNLDPKFYGLAIWHWYQRTATSQQKREFDAMFSGAETRKKMRKSRIEKRGFGYDGR